MIAALADRRDTSKRSWTMKSALLVLLSVLTGCMSLSRSGDKLQQDLWKAIDDRDAAAVQRLLDEGADVEAKYSGGATPLILAAKSNNAVVVKILLQHGANASAQDQNRETAFIHAARSGNYEAVELLWDKTPDPKVRTEALFEAAISGAVGVVYIEAPRIGPPPVPQPAQEPPEVRTVQVLLDRGVPVDARNEYDDATPLIVAAAHGQQKVVQLLLQRGATVDAVDRDGNTALIGAACECAVATMPSTYEVVELLITNHADINASAHDGTTALMNAASSDRLDNVVLLLKNGANLRIRNNEGKTALMLATEGGYTEVAKVLRKASLH